MAHDIRQGENRQRLLQAASALFAAKGFSGTSVREIVAAAGVTKPVLYYYFGSKEQLYLTLMEETYSLFLERSTTLTGTPGSCRERVIAFCSGIYDDFLQQVDAVRLIYAAYFGPPHGAPGYPLDQFFSRMFTALQEMLEQGIAAGELHGVTGEDAAWAVISALNIVMQEQLCHQPPRIDRSGLLRILQVTLNGMTRSGI